jgi:sulfite reductase (ferredoxin)
VNKQKDGLFYVGAAPVAGRVSGSILVEVAKIAEQAGSQRVRFTPQQKIIVLDVPEAEVSTLKSNLAKLGLQVEPSPWRRGIMACTGIEFCKLAIVETKARARDLIEELERRFPELDTLSIPGGITVNVNGCPNACARTQTADIGLKGQLVMHEGEQVGGFQVHLGGATGLGANFGRKLRAHKVTSEGLDDYVTVVVSNFLADRADGESFADWVARADEELLRGERTLEAAVR